ncbi:esterase/lipase family protein [Rhodoferax antarcticus]|uniref:PGAP1-like family protein n=1 Tax=Rhodoferax antarcticus ANT.BR TaxID=1111071 RepID=A0A1Q8YJ41_9BURK|nr:permease [Rhodoferax antarcticus]APW47809.1 permease [Rhodoferax antarcticus]OLP08036.1 PGAP1-like family protein [Rhodoferax antarcticus ANT.BR]
MTAAAKLRTSEHVRASDLRAAALLATEATHAIASMAEGVHQAVWRTLGAPSGATPEQARGLTGRVYQGIQGITGLIGRSLNSALIRLEPLLQRLEGQGDESPERAAIIAALNGVMGDRLKVSGNPLALPMTLSYQEHVAQSAQGLEANLASNKLLIVMHGLCMNDAQWTTEHADGPINPAETLAQTLGYTPIYLRYNSGLHVSQNGRLLAQRLEDLVTQWPSAVQEVSALTHSMGGLVMRSALFYAQQDGLRWPALLKNMVFLGTPHHGAPLERAGNWVDEVLGSTPYSRPFAKLGQLRSAGVTDLRYGHLLDVDWQGHDRFRRKPDSRQPVPLPAGVRCFAVAATNAAKRGSLADRLLGDGLVPLPSALGQHADPARCLSFAPEHQHILYRTHHLQLLSSPEVTRQLLQWLA